MARLDIAKACTHPFFFSFLPFLFSFPLSCTYPFLSNYLLTGKSGYGINVQRRVGEEGTIVVSIVPDSVADVSGLVSSSFSN